MNDKQISDFLEMGSISKPSRNPPKSPLSPEKLKQQMSNWANVIRPREYPYLFKNAEAFKQFKSLMRGLLGKYRVLEGKIVVQGSSLRTPNAKDVDVAVFVSDEVFAQYAQRCRDGIDTRASNRAKKKLLANLEREIERGYISKFNIDRLPEAPRVAFGDEVNRLIETPFGIETDVSVMKQSSYLALYPFLEF